MPPAFNLSQDQTLSFDLWFVRTPRGLDSQNGIDIILMIRICFCPYERLLLSPENPCGYQGVGDFAQTPTLIGCWLLKSVLQTSAGRRGYCTALVWLLRHQRRSGIMRSSESSVKRPMRFGVSLLPGVAKPVAPRSHGDAILGILHRNQLRRSLGPLTWTRVPLALPARLTLTPKCQALDYSTKKQFRKWAGWLAAPSPRDAAQRCLKSGGRFSRNAAMPSFWSAVANSEWNTRRSKSTPSLSGDS